MSRELDGQQSGEEMDDPLQVDLLHLSRPALVAEVVDIVSGLGRVLALHHAAIGALCTRDGEKAREQMLDANKALEAAIARVTSLATSEADR